MSQRDLGGYFDMHNVITPQDIASATEVNTNTGMYVSMVGHEWGVMVCSATLTDTKTAIFELTQASDASATGKADVSGKTVTLTGAAASSLNQVGHIFFNVNDLTDASETKHFVGCDCTTNQNGDDVSVVLLLGGGDYQSSSNT
jgi:hypothetical protein